MERRNVTEGLDAQRLELVDFVLEEVVLGRSIDFRDSNVKSVCWFVASFVDGDSCKREMRCVTVDPSWWCAWEGWVDRCALI
jgi:hypothetical protein